MFWITLLRCNSPPPFRFLVFFSFSVFFSALTFVVLFCDWRQRALSLYEALSVTTCYIFLHPPHSTQQLLCPLARTYQVFFRLYTAFECIFDSAARRLPPPALRASSSFSLPPSLRIPSRISIEIDQPFGWIISTNQAETAKQQQQQAAASRAAAAMASLASTPKTILVAGGAGCEYTM